MDNKRSFFSLVVAKQRLYAVGGLMGKGQYLNTVEYYDPLENKWYPVQRPMNIPRAFTSAVVYKEHIYAIGGEIKTGVDTASVERFDGNEWKLVRHRKYQWKIRFQQKKILSFRRWVR